MQTVSELYREIVQDAKHRKEVKLFVSGVEHPMENILSLKTIGGLFETVSIGNTVGRQINAQIIPVGEIPRMAELRPYIRVRLGEQVSEWIPKGVFYIDTRRVDDVTGALTLHGFDAMLKASPNYIDVDDESGTWPRKCRVVVEDIAYRMGLELDERTVLQDYDVEYMPLTSGREILGWIAAMHGANWTITDAGKLRLVPLVPTGDGPDVGRDMSGLETAPDFAPFTGVQFYYEDKDIISAGTSEGRVLEIECPWATQEIAEAVLAQISGYVYRPYTATDAILDPAAELGDPITVSGTQSVLASCEAAFNALMTADIAAPEDEEIDHEYPYSDPTIRRTRREIALAKAEIKIGVDSIQQQVTGLNGELAQLRLEVDGITLEVTSVSTSGGKTYARIRLKGGNGEWQEGQILLDGNVNVSGQLSAEALYAVLGDVSNLMVNRLSTSRRIPKYLAGDTTDDRYWIVEGESQRMVRAWTDGSTERARNPDGVLLYWEQDISNAIRGANGYPEIDGVQVPTTTTPTPYEVWVYKYQEGDRWKQTFAEDGNYGPRQIWGEGDGTSSGNGRGYQEKLGLSFDIYNKGTDGVKRGVFMGNDFTHITGLRKYKSITEDGDDIVVVLEGDITETFTRSYGSDGGLLGVTDQTGFYTAVTNSEFLPIVMLPKLLAAKTMVAETVAMFLYGRVAKNGETPTHTLNGVSYVGAVLPDINTVWTDEMKKTFMFAVIDNAGSVNVPGSKYVLRIFTSKVMVNIWDNGLCVDSGTERIYLLMNGTWEFYQEAFLASDGYTLSNISSVIWSNEDIYAYRGSTSLYFSASEPVRVYE